MAEGTAPFPGFAAGHLDYTPLPSAFFVRLLPLVDDLAELKLTLYAFWTVHHKRLPLACVGEREAVDDAVRLRLLAEPTPEVVRAALTAAVRRGTLLRADVAFGDRQETLYFLNTAAGREALARLRSGELELDQTVLEVGLPTPSAPPRPNVYVLYEQNIGLLTPLIAEELRAADARYPAEWLEAAIRLAVEYNRRSWRYVKRILERWEVEGRADLKDQPRARRARPHWPDRSRR